MTGQTSDQAKNLRFEIVLLFVTEKSVGIIYHFCKKDIFKRGKNLLWVEGQS